MSTTSSQKSAPTQPIKQIDTKTLIVGDIIATRSNTAGSSGIRFLTGGQVSHAILYTGFEFAVDAMPDEGVTKDRLHNKLNQASYAAVFRSRTATTEQRMRACEWAELQARLHKPYDLQSAARVGRPKHTRVGRLIVIGDNLSAWMDPEGEDASFMCSELVFRAFEIAGAPLIDTPAHNLSPGMLFKTDRLDCLGRLV